ncbi:hypothetical protein PoB_003713800 [Plakobranchus ocellatus]|uniref:Uncharacterized protein n=1 Tax=Plakobranchus ocellatus TaxID=259542 RepID=A0AAV4AVQ2_9GAST|nr:hypothetical protein PoB_003713800 [Plakobranchus ocellatus]
MEVLQALKEPEKEDDTDGYWWRGLKSMLKELDPIESLKFKYEVTGLLLTYVECAKIKKKAATRFIDDRFTNSPSPNCVQSLATSTPKEEYSAATRSINDRFTNSLSPNLQSLATSTPREEYSAATRSINDRFANFLSPNLQSLATSTPREEYSAATRSINEGFTNSLSPNLQSLATSTIRKVSSVCPATDTPWYKLEYQQF